MALNNRSETAPIYLTIINGKIAQKVKEGVEGAVSRLNKNQQTVWELQFDSLSARLTNIEIREQEFAGQKVKSWEFTLKDVDQTYKLQTVLSGRMPNGILFRLPNIDLAADIEIRTFYFEKEEKSTLTIYQYGQKVDAAFTKDMPNGLPPLEKVTFKGEERWDDTKQQAFLKDLVFTQIMPKLSQLNAAKPAAPSAQEMPEFHSETDKAREDMELPF